MLKYCLCLLNSHVFVIFQVHPQQSYEQKLHLIILKFEGMKSVSFHSKFRQFWKWILERFLWFVFQFMIVLNILLLLKVQFFNRCLSLSKLSILTIVWSIAPGKVHKDIVRILLLWFCVIFLFYFYINYMFVYIVIWNCRKLRYFNFAEFNNPWNAWFSNFFTSL